MGEKRGWGSTVLGWFVVRDGEEVGEEAEAAAASPASGDSEADALIAKYAGGGAGGETSAAAASAAAAVPGVQLTGALPPSSGGKVDFAAVFRAATIDDEEQARIDKARTLLGTLPAETPRDTKRQIVEASLKAFGVPIDKIIETGAEQIQALELYIQSGQRETQALLTESQKRLEELTAEIGRVQQVMQEQVAAQEALTRSCNDEKLRVQAVLEFFGQDAVARVVRESPKLVSPEASGGAQPPPLPPRGR
jgi:hypothetical protein